MMRADRLISVLMLLQSRGRMTARELAEALDVSERTVYRDVEALCASGVPLYAEHGPGGGLALLDSYRTNLTGLKEDELRALFMMFSAAGPLDKLGNTQALKSAVLKLSAALPDMQRPSEEKVRQRFFLDWSWWFHAQEPVPHLSAIQQAIWEDRRMRLRYRTYLLAPIEVEVEPYGLVAKAGIWYLVAKVEAGAPRVYHVSWLINAELLESTFERPLAFNLATFWQDWCAEYEENQQVFQVTLCVSPELLRMLPLYFGRRAVDWAATGKTDAEGWTTLTLWFESLESARGRILDFGSAAEVLEPEALRRSILDYAEQIVQFYTPGILS